MLSAYLQAGIESAVSRDSLGIRKTIGGDDVSKPYDGGNLAYLRGGHDESEHVLSRESAGGRLPLHGQHLVPYALVVFGNIGLEFVMLLILTPDDGTDISGNPCRTETEQIRRGI